MTGAPTRPSDCPRLAAELVHVSRTKHATKADVHRRKEDHRRWCICGGRGYAVPPNLSRDIERTA